MNSMLQPLKVFLDSSDYSTLSDPARRTPELDEVLRRLIQFRDRGLVRYCFSASVISEMVPLEAEHRAHAHQRFELLDALGEGNSLLWHEDLLRKEIEAVLELRESSRVDVCEGGWLIPSMLPSGLDLFGGMNREERRRAIKERRQMLRNGLMPEGLAAAPYPQRFKLALMQYSGNQISESELKDVFVRELGKPMAFLEYLLSTQDGCKEFSDIVRGSSRSMSGVALDVMHAAQKVHLLDEEVASSTLDSQHWRETSDAGVVHVFKSLAQYFGLAAGSELTLSAIESKAPGFSTMIRTMYSAVWPSAQKQARKPKDSDFVDALHATYAPYVDVFRTDQFMTPLVRTAVSKYGTDVVGKLPLVPDAIQKWLDQTEG